MTPTADTNEIGCLRPPADGWERFPQARYGTGHMVRILQAGGKPMLACIDLSHIWVADGWAGDGFRRTYLRAY
jgi:hypothetical protein